mmetsp:Transcript_15204/g.61110  ORF Transcript_15204/g.61110 Transcript_15204/m.61110 type:complete len:206 (-) Transcript_15204:63-680(-)
MVGRPVRGPAGDVVEIQLAHEDARGLEVDALVLAEHGEAPAGRVARGVALVQRRVERGVVADDGQDDVARVRAVRHDRLEGRPLRPRRRVDDVVPAHLVDAGLEEPLEVRVERTVPELRDAELVDGEGRGVRVVEDERVPQAVGGGRVEAVPRERREEHFGERPAILEVGFELGAHVRGRAVEPRNAERAERAGRRVEPRTLFRA